MVSEHRNILRWSMKATGKPQDVMAIDVAGAYFTTQGVSLRRDVDYMFPVALLFRQVSPANQATAISERETVAVSLGGIPNGFFVYR
jgi:hypothetical protein